MAHSAMDLNLNFSVDELSLTKSLTSVKGGRWTERFKAKRATKAHLQSSAKKTEEFNLSRDFNSFLNEAEVYNHKPLANQKFKEKSAEQPSKGPPAGVDGTFVSSLWTSNPQANTKIELQTEKSNNQLPSNAAIADGSSTFTSLGLSLVLASHLAKKLLFHAPTAIQRSTIPQLLIGNCDALIQAETGSGKTLAYLLPIVDRIMRISTRSNRSSGLYAIILAPTRELSRQIYAVLQTIIHCKNGPHWIVPGLVVGGEKKKSEKARIRKGINILVATPGRLLDHLETTISLQVDRLKWLVLDEGDRLMELGFEEPITKIIGFLNNHMRPHRPHIDHPMPSKRVTILCSATMKSTVQKLGEKSLRDALFIKSVKDEKGDFQGLGDSNRFHAPTQLRQSYIIIPAKLRLVGLNAVLRRAFVSHTATPKVVVFFSCTDSVDYHFEVFSRRKDAISRMEDRKSPAIAPAPLLNAKLVIHKLHGSLPQSVRTSTLSSFINSKNPTVLLCTDVAARGLDLPNLDLVVQFDPPFTPDDHLHRIGRTARAGRQGRAVIFLLPGPEEGYIETVLKKGIQEGKLIRKQYDEIIQKGFNNGDMTKRSEWEDKATEWHLHVERWTMETPKVKKLASRAWGSHIRAYTTHMGEEKSIFNHTSLHYGHLAKSFGLTDNPTSIKVPALDEGGGRVGVNGSMNLGGRKRNFVAEDSEESTTKDAVRKMRKIAKAIEGKRGLSSEFNIG